MFETLKNLLVEELQLDPDEITMESELANDLGGLNVLNDTGVLCKNNNAGVTRYLIFHTGTDNG